jgi:hypothetical protein
MPQDHEPLDGAAGRLGAWPLSGSYALYDRCAAKGAARQNASDRRMCWSARSYRITWIRIPWTSSLSGTHTSPRNPKDK